jgi:hypothetical protein
MDNVCFQIRIFIPQRDAPELYPWFRALPEQRARGMPDARCTRDLMCNVHKKVRT